MAQPASTLDRFYSLLPAIHRARDAERGEPLRALLQVIAGQFELVERDIAGLYENWFIETCEPWVVPYIGDLVGWEPVDEGAGDVRRTRILSSRRDVANVIRSRRRKGTLAWLEELARDVAGWPARAVEFAHLVALTPALDHPQSWAAGGLVDVRAGARLDAQGGPFESFAHTPDVRRIHSLQRSGRHNLPSVGVFVWRLQLQSVTRAPACCVEEVGPEWFTFSALGHDSPLFVRPEPETDAAGLAEPHHVPGTITRRALQEDLRAASPRYYGVDRSFAIWAEDWPVKGSGAPAAPIPSSAIVAADSSEFRNTPQRNQVAVDPVLGRIAFPTRQLPRRVWVSYHTAFSANLGGGEYTRELGDEPDAELIVVRGQDQLRRALQSWHGRRSDDGGESSEAQPEHAIIEIGDSGVYVVPFDLWLAPGHTLQLRAAQNTRPVIRLLDWQTDRPDSLAVSGGEGSRFEIDGLIVSGRGMRIDGALRSVVIRHSTLVPGWTLEPNCEPRRPAEPSIEITSSQTCLVVDHSIVGSIQVNVDEVCADPIQLRISDSIVDATGSDCEGSECEAIGSAGAERAHAVLNIARSTVIGRVMVHAIELAEDSIFTGRVTVARRQIGCMRFSWIADCSRTPRRFACQPSESGPVRVRPRFVSTRFGTPAYCQLAPDCPVEISAGAHDQSEMGVFHDLYQPQRLANLRKRLDEYVPSAADVAVIFVT